MRILLAGRFSDSQEINGPLYYSRSLAGKLKNAAEVKCIEYFFDGGKYSAIKKLFGSEIAAGPAYTGRYGIFSVFLQVFKFKPELVHITQFERFTVILVLLKFIFNYKLVYTCHGIVGYEDNLKGLPGLYKVKNRLAEYLILKYSDSIIAFSDVTAKIANDEYSIKLSPVIIPPGIDPIVADTNSRKLSGQKLRLLFMGRFAKREEAAIDLIERLAPYLVPFQIITVGFSEQHAERLKNIHNDVLALGSLTGGQWIKTLADSDVFVVAMKNETFSISSLEAIAAGALVIAEHSTGIGSVLDQTTDGLTFDSDNPTEFMNILERINSNREMLKILQNKLRPLIDKFTWRNALKRHVEIYQNLNDRQI